MTMKNDVVRDSLKTLRENNFYLSSVIKSLEVTEPDYGILLKITKIETDIVDYVFSYRCDDRIVFEYKFRGEPLDFSSIQTIFINLKYCIDACNGTI